VKTSTRILALTFFVGSFAVSSFGEEDLRTLVRGGCPNESDCCFGKWKVKADAPVYQTDDAIDKIATVKAGEFVEATSGRVHTEPGKMKVVFKHGDWKKGDVIGLYEVPGENGKARFGTASKTDHEAAPFIAKGSKCEKPSKDCWAHVQSQPQVKWWIKIKLPEDRSGWVDAANVVTDAECQL
jgi:hypothetical protein